MNMKMSRRNFMVLTASFSVLVFGAGFTTYFYSRQKILVSEILKNQFPDVSFNATFLNIFCDDFIQDKYFDRFSSVKYSLIYKLLRAMPNNSNLPFTRELDLIERNVVTHFIQTTDFLETSKSEVKNITFYGMPIACTNQFAEFT